MPKAITGNSIFLNERDALANDINTKANKLYQQLVSIDITRLDTADKYRNYFSTHHLGRRLFFSLQNSAHIIYQSVKKSGKQVNDIIFMDYGAGLGTLFILAGMMGFKKTVYNDYFPEWHQPAKALCDTLGIQIDDYIAGDISDTLKQATAGNFQFDIIASRNVIEHIYNLPHFYNCIFKHNSKTITYSTTTANYHNPVMRLYHIYLHNKWERIAYSKQRREEIKKLYPSIAGGKLEQLVKLTRGKGQKDFSNAVEEGIAGKTIEKDSMLRSNTCDCVTGVWNEHLLTKKEYGIIISNAGFKMEYTPGFWDTHYKSAIINKAAAFFNKIILLLGNKGIILSPFVNVTAFN